MLDLQFICDNLETVSENCKARGVIVDVSTIVELRNDRNSRIASADDLRRRQKEVSSQIPKASADDRPALIAQGKELRQQIADIDAELKDVEARILELQSQIPNLTHPDAPFGGEHDANELRIVGNLPEFDFSPRDHVDIADNCDLIDFDAGSRVAGHGFYYLKNDAVMLEMALVQFALQKLRAEDFTLYSTPDLARDSVLQGIGFSPRGDETQIYSVADTDLSLVATAEITLGGALADQVLDIADLPIRCGGLSHCFRTEAGAHGRATRGIYRVHQFTKVEMFAFTPPDLEASTAVHEDIVRIEEEIFQALEVPYRLIDTATGDLGAPAYRKFDLEAWMPGRGDGGEWGEVTSASNCTDYQARRLNIRCRSSERKGTQFVHTLNGTAVSCARAIIAVIENHQQSDGGVVIPEALRPWMGKDAIAPVAKA